MNEHEPQADRAEETRPRPKIYVASLSDYNAGLLHGAWLEAAQDPEALLAGISVVLAASPEPGAEEWAVHDYEGFGLVRLSEYQSVETISQLALGIEEHGYAFSAWADYVGATSLDELERFDECYLGEWDSETQYAEELIEDTGLISQIESVLPEGLQPYVRIDYEGLGRDMVLGGDIIAVESIDRTSVFVFSPL
jgi:antirestriction protein